MDRSHRRIDLPARLLIEALRARGVSVTCAGGRLRIEPASRAPPEVQAALRANKPAVLAALRAEEEAPTPRAHWRAFAAILHGEPLAGPLAERIAGVGLWMQAVERDWRRYLSDAEWIAERDHALEQLTQIEAELARRGETFETYGWRLTPKNRWRRPHEPDDDPSLRQSDPGGHPEEVQDG
jgi:hypothetical protein